MPCKPGQHFVIALSLAEAQSVAVAVEHVQLDRLPRGHLLAPQFQRLRGWHTAVCTTMQHEQGDRDGYGDQGRRRRHASQ